MKILTISAMLTVTLMCASSSFAIEESNYSLNRIKTLTGHKENVRTLIFNHTGDLLATGGEDELIILWDTKEWNEVRRLKGHGEKIGSLAFSTDGNILASSDSEKVILWDVKTGKEIKRVKIDDNINSITFSPDAKTLAIASNSDNLLLWDITSTNIRKLAGHKSDLKDVAFSHNGKTLASCSKEKTIFIWDLSSGKVLLQLKGNSDEVNSIAFTPNDKYLATEGNDNKIVVWDLSTGSIKHTIAGNLSGIKGLAFLNNGEVIVSGVQDSKFSCKIQFWETKSGKILASERSDCSSTNFAFSPDDKYVAIAANGIALMKRVPTTSPTLDVVDIKKPLDFSEVVLVPNVKADELFKRAKEWVVTTLLTSSEVLQVVDKENGILIGKGSIKYEPDTFMSKAALTGTIRFIVKILLKDGKYKYTFTDFTHTGTTVTIKNMWGASVPLDLSYGLLTNSEEAPDGMQYRSSVWEHMKQVSSEASNKMIVSLTAHMDKSVKINNDW